MDHHAATPATPRQVHIAITGRVLDHGPVEGAMHLPAALTRGGDLWITATDLTITDREGMADLQQQVAQARREADMHRQHATDLRAYLLDLGDAIIHALHAATAGADPIAYLRTWANGLTLAPAGAETEHSPATATSFAATPQQPETTAAAQLPSVQASAERALRAASHLAPHATNGDARGPGGKRPA
jgi:hypothetical protein